MSDPQKPIESQVYSADYFLTECEGHDKFLRSGGKELPRRLAVALELAGDVRGKRVLDLGCGRGEVVRNCPVFLSLHEGFGLAPLEAMACGVQIVAMRSCVVEEVQTHAAILVDDPFEIPTFGQEITFVLQTLALRVGIVDKGLERAAL